MNTGSASIHTFCAGVYVLHIPCSEDIRDEGHHNQLQLAYQLLWLKMWLEYPTRKPVLHHNCLVRDHNLEIQARSFQSKGNDDQPLIFASRQLSQLEVTHIPHSVMLAIVTVNGKLQLVRICNIYKESESKKPALAILNMFDLGISHLTE
uniref:Uncharacterized protein n=1 Tax=Coccidioides posadasii RMSCC 3488 TaxID=454284 RepID=A0A0J6IHF1_COCPO|nr:hypothetical protein CPAG_07559 [Coccidioides posadasii RMSCC 3488]